MFKKIKRWYKLLGWHLQKQTPTYRIYAYHGSLSRGGNTAWFIQTKNNHDNWITYGFYRNAIDVVRQQKILDQKELDHAE
jgi:hypothetical protein